MADKDNNETEDLCDQLIQQESAMHLLKDEIHSRICERDEYQEIVIQMQKRGIFLPINVK